MGGVRGWVAIPRQPQVGWGPPVVAAVVAATAAR